MNSPGLENKKNELCHYALLHRGINRPQTHHLYRNNTPDIPFHPLVSQPPNLISRYNSQQPMPWLDPVQPPTNPSHETRHTGKKKTTIQKQNEADKHPRCDLPLDCHRSGSRLEPRATKPDSRTPDADGSHRDDVSSFGNSEACVEG